MLPMSWIKYIAFDARQNPKVICCEVIFKLLLRLLFITQKCSPNRIVTI